MFFMLLIYFYKLVIILEHPFIYLTGVNTNVKLNFRASTGP